MYKFRDTIEAGSENNRLPSEALLLNGKAIEDSIHGYRTLTVSGRELIAPELNTVRRTNADGAMYLRKSFPPRTITVQYELKAIDNEMFRLSYEKLNNLLLGEQQELRFVDDLDYSFYGTLSDVSQVPEGTNTVIGSFSFYCSDPFKYSNPTTIKGAAPSIVYNDKLHLIKPDVVKLTLKANTDNFTMRSGDKEIKIFPFSFNSGEEVTFDFINNSIVNTVDGVESSKWEILEYLNLDSDYESFYLYSGKPITLNSSADIEVTYRRKLL